MERAACAGDEAFAFHALQQRCDGVGVQHQARGNVAHGQVVPLPQYQEHQVLRIGDTEWLEVWAVGLGDKSRDSVEPKAKLLLQFQLVVHCSEHCFDGLLDGFGLGGGGESLHLGAVARNEEFGEVPLDVAVLFDGLAQPGVHGCRSFGLEAFELFGGSLLLEVGKDGVLLFAVDVYLLHDLEGDTVIDAAELGDFTVTARVLVGKLVAWEPDDYETFVAVFLVEFLKTVELGSKATFAGGVDDEEHLALKLGEVYLLAIAGDCFVIVNRRHVF